MPYWVKRHERDDWTYDYEWAKIDYHLECYAGPFRDLTSAEEYIKGQYLLGATILEFE